jgi:hypothetical protein
MGLLLLRPAAHRSSGGAAGSRRLPLPGLPAPNGQCLRSARPLRRPYKVVGTPAEYLRSGDQGARFTFRFCPVCGTTLFHTEQGCEQSSVSVAVGAFADPGFPAPEVSVYECRRHRGVEMPPGIRAYDKDPL